MSEKLNTEKRSLLLKGLRYVKSEKVLEIERIERRTEADYAFDREILPALGKTFSLTKAKDEDVSRVQVELQEVEELMELVNDATRELQIV
ncbi:hypothetical protein CN495_07695 [Bacillus thuringiensis]|uniref:Uncharacterized protein n=1 Tax=Bacillus thuringiensis TaxID=1428 RepID=A0ABD6S721_BACTU|nr:hypothetical protein [Bacillus thuringiensis]PER55629.1 hypothetical protein CN495_07695 [Bacillus thuringiensis]